MMKSTRSDDLDKIDQLTRNAKTEKQEQHSRALLSSLYEQMKDPYLERMRVKLIDSLRRLNQPGDITSPAKQEAWRDYLKIQASIKSYASSSTFQAQIAKRIAKEVNTEQAGIFFEKGVNKS